MKTFSEFVASRRITATPRGDFIADTVMLIELGKFPSITCWGQLRCFMMGRNACREAVAEGRKLWRQYQKSLTLEDILS